MYSLSVQMPNITSYFGSWMLWLSDPDPAQKAGLQPPSPLRKVDPRYVPSAVAEKIEGVVRLSALPPPCNKKAKLVPCTNEIAIA